MQLSPAQERRIGGKSAGMPEFFRELTLLPELGRMSEALPGQVPIATGLRAEGQGRALFGDAL
jgi:hypothetical protein